ncbi:hypothetical protein GCM10023169_31670 [Georgenia halophila]|uniref:Flagellar protein FlgN n=1 Tax=Georgenia halophila TaxID=620889 RepID=A0ABP8LGP5_9MICO
MSDIYIDLGELETVKSQLDAIVTEFKKATDRSEALEAAIGRPFFRSELQDKAREFEERWDDKRTVLEGQLSDVRDHVKGVIDGVEKWDAEAAVSLTPEK